MSWNDSGNKDPWSNKQPPDLEEALKKFQKQLNSFLRGKRKSNGSNSPFGRSKFPIDLGGQQTALGLVGVGAFVLWVLSGIFIVNPAEQAAISVFGKYSETVDPGPHWIPPLIANKVLINVDRVSDYSYKAQMLTKDENLVTVSIAVQYRIGDLKAYLYNITDPEESLRQATSSALRQVVGTTTLDQLITAGREIWGGQVQESLVKILEKYNTGIQIISVAPQPARAPDNVQSSFDDAIKAQEDERRFIEQARAYEAKVVPIAQGHAKRINQEAEAFAKQVVFEAEGQTAEFNLLLPQYEKAPQVTGERMYIETMQSIMGKHAKVFIDAKQSPNMYLPFMQKLLPQSTEKSSVNDSSDWKNTSNKFDSDQDNLEVNRFAPIVRRVEE
jgi:membrane protease subunit HflK